VKRKKKFFIIFFSNKTSFVVDEACKRWKKSSNSKWESRKKDKLAERERELIINPSTILQNAFLQLFAHQHYTPLLQQLQQWQHKDSPHEISSFLLNASNSSTPTYPSENLMKNEHSFKYNFRLICWLYSE
jgi:hypothetical protein